jgi:hypothetical protein
MKEPREIVSISRAMNSTAGWIPDQWWRKESLLKAFGKAGGLLMGSGRINLTGKVSNGQRFFANPKIVRPIESSQAVVCGRNLGRTAPLSDQANLADVWLPQNGRFFVGNVSMEPFDPARHLTTLSRYSEKTREYFCYASRHKPKH